MNYAVATITLMLVAGLAQAQESCAEKKAEITRQLEHAQTHGNAGRVRGLETALEKVQANCTDAGLRAERQEKIEEAREEVAERKADLQEALKDGSPEKIEKRKQKLAEAEDELRDAQAD
ncbi:DUF1090 domain-containing protein [Stutzerimonas azotifigens]|uniref:DUF1090 domain-containing protein n=1 Tax=Stutzerimonas azotifigens TaxID=291995 RepID=A0ABR5YZA5_9GAMM|nr:DUF1090 domain-containing protein [Stutzerimonas azotifigens]MBA1273282.1 DUF1090 domain-containing protein [Stutzerimonas azotifigens]